MKTKKQEILNELDKFGFHLARIISFSKSSYHNKYPHNVTIFNANLIDEKLGKIYWGDLDLTKDAMKLKEIAKKFKTTFYILKEMDARFDNENKPIKELIKKSIWNTKQFIPVYDKEYNIKMFEIKHKNIELASQDNTHKYEKEMNVILKLLGHPEALVTDESCIGDFLEYFGNKEENEKNNKKLLSKIELKLGFPVKKNDFLIDIAKKISNK